MNGIRLPPDIVAFREERFNEYIPLEVLHHILKTHGVTTIWEMREGGAVYEMICELLDPCYDGEEGYWTSNYMDWLLYASHEHALTVAGMWLVPEIQAAWPQWQEHVWHS